VLVPIGGNEQRGIVKNAEIKRQRAHDYDLQNALGRCKLTLFCRLIVVAKALC
jgi:hypothetical protein